MRAALSIAFYALVFASFPVFFAGALALFLITAPFDRRRVLLHLYACFWSCSYFYVHPRWRVRVVGRRRLPWRGAAVIVANHQSLVDFLVLGALYRPFRWVAKAEVFRVPFVGWTMRLAGHVGLERGAGGSIVRMMRRCRELLEAGVPVLLFPEGTRSEDGTLGRFRDGAFTLAAAVGCPVYPVVVTGTGDFLPKRGIVLHGALAARVEVLEPLAPAGFASAELLRDACRDAIAAKLALGA